MPSDSAVLHQPTQHVDPRCRPWWATQILITTAIVLITPVLLGSLIAPIRTIMFAISAALLVIGVVLAIFVPRYLMRTHRWDVTEIGIYSRRGWLWQEWRAAPFARLQTVDVTTGPIQRIFGLSTVRATTASAQGPVLIEAVNTALGNDLAQRLTALAQEEGEGDGT